MLIKAKTLKGYVLIAIDGEIGYVKDFYFDDKQWIVRFLVAETGNWLIGKKVLISPYAIGVCNEQTEKIEIKLSKNEIEISPSFESNKPVSLQFETEYYECHKWPTNWNGTGMWGLFPNLTYTKNIWDVNQKMVNTWDPHLRSTNEVSGYVIQAKNGEIGHVMDFIIDDKTWAIRYLIIDTTNWFGGKKVLISPKWIQDINWEESKILINLSLEEIKKAPEYAAEDLLTRDYETQLHAFYNHSVYWRKDNKDRLHFRSDM